MRLIAVMEKRLAETPHLAGEAYSIADVCSYPWVKAILGPLRDKAGDKLSPTPAVDRWLESVGARPAVQRGMAVPKV